MHGGEERRREWSGQPFAGKDALANFRKPLRRVVRLEFGDGVQIVTHPVSTGPSTCSTRRLTGPDGMLSKRKRPRSSATAE